jgi:hypothetical protein
MFVISTGGIERENPTPPEIKSEWEIIGISSNGLTIKWNYDAAG